MPLPTPRALLLLAAGLPLSFAPVLLGPSAWPLGVAAVAAVAIAWLIDLRRSARPADWRVDLAVPETLFIGDADPMRIELLLKRDGARESGARHARYAMVQVDLDARFEPVATAPILFDEREGGALGASLTLPLVPIGRGTGAVEAIWLRWDGPLGLVRRGVRVAVDRPIAVVPNLRAVHAAALRFARSSSSFSGRKPERFHGDGSEFESLREFEPGYDARTLDWKASARHLRLLSREFRAERNHQLVLALDCGQRMREPIDDVSRLDRAINASLLLSFVGLKHGDQVGLFAFDATPKLFEPPVAGMAAFARLRRRSADLEASTEATNFTLGLTELLNRLRRRALVILFTDFADAIGAELLVENVARVAKRHVVLFVALRDPELERIALAPPASERDLHRAVVAHDLAHDRAVVLEQVERLGVHVLDLRAEDVSSKLVNRYLEIKRRELVA